MESYDQLAEDQEAEIINGDEHEQEQNWVVTGRSYDCIFCKRGFTTAQALGGHMNIHRKDRAKAKPTVASTKSHAIFKQAQSNQPNYYKFMDSSSSSFSFANAKLPSFCGNQFGLITPLALHAALQMSLSSNFVRVHGELAKKKKMVERDPEDDQLDLELRLGYN